MPLFTVETAREYQAKAVKARLAAKIANKQATPQPSQAIPQDPPQVTDTYIERRLSRVREQIDRLSDMLDEEEEPQKLDRITAAIERLSKLEQTLAGRPLPGSLRPVERSSKRGLGSFSLSPNIPENVPLRESPKPIQPETPANPNLPKP